MNEREKKKERENKRTLYCLTTLFVIYVFLIRLGFKKQLK